MPRGKYESLYREEQRKREAAERYATWLSGSCVILARERDELKADLVWAAKHWANTEVFGPDGKVLAYNDLKSPALRTYVDYDGTPDGLCAAVRAARSPLNAL